MRVTALFSCIPSFSPYSLFPSGEGKSLFLLGFQEKSLRPAPPPVEILPSKDAQSDKYTTEVINLNGGLQMLKVRVGNVDLHGVHNSEIIPGKCEGLKLWESSIDLVNTLKREVQDGLLSFRGKRVLELGCGNGLPGIYACLKGASTVHFQDFNSEVLRCVTIPNTYANLQNARGRMNRNYDGLLPPTQMATLSPDVHFYAGDWGDMHTLLSTVQDDESNTLERNLTFSEDDPLIDHSFIQNCNSSDQDTQAEPNNRLGIKRKRKLSGSRAYDRANDTHSSEGGYDIILMSETIYSSGAMRKLYDLLKKCLRPPYGVVYLATKKHHFCGGGGVKQFRSLIEEDGNLGVHLVVEFSDGPTNVKEIWKFFHK